jgi:hypothetical protein
MGKETRDRVLIERHLGSTRQLGGIRAFELTDGRARGTRCLQVDTGTGGLSFTVVADRGLDIADCTFKGTNLVYHCPGGIAHPAYCNPAGLEWLRTFFGGLLTTCGLTYFGEPGRDGAVELGLHGRHSSLPAARVCDLSRWEGDRYVLEVTGIVEDCVLFGDRIRLTRAIRAEAGSRTIAIRDTAENVGASASPFTILYHVNPGYPLLQEGSRIVVSSRSVEPYDERSRAQAGAMYDVEEPTPGYTEVNYLHSVSAGRDGRARAALVNPNLAGGIGLAVSWDPGPLPFLSEWKMMGVGDYVVGLEPANTRVATRGTLRAAGKLPFLEPGESRVMDVRFDVLEGAQEIEQFIAEANA